jgi:NMD protein affecting ribosome stability and mRNA decay
MAIFLQMDVCFHCKKEKEFQTEHLCRECSKNKYCIDGCQTQNEVPYSRCKKCQKKHDKGMRAIKQFLIDNKLVHEDLKA